MQSIRQYREIGRFVEHTHYQEDNRSKDAPVSASKPKRPPLPLPLPSLGPNIQEQWNSDVEKQLESCSSSQIWKSQPTSCASTDKSLPRPSSSCYSSDASTKAQLDDDYGLVEKPAPLYIRASSELDKTPLPDSGYVTDTSKSQPSTRKSSVSTEAGGKRFSAIRPDESAEHIISRFSPQSSEETIASTTFECPRSPPPTPEQLERRRIIPVHSYGAADPTNPRNWPLGRRVCAFVLVALLSFTQTWAGSADASYNSAAAEALGVSRTLASLNTAMFSLGIGVGSMFVGPLSETFGRNMLYFVAGLGYLFAVMATALSRDIVGQVVSRLFVGLFTSVTGSVSGSSVHDMFDVRERSIVFPLLALMNTLRKYSRRS